MKIQEFERVRVTRPVSRYHLSKGAIGTVLEVHADGQAFEVEFPELEETDITATLNADEIAPVAPALTFAGQ